MATYNSNLNEVLLLFQNNINSAMQKSGEFGKSEIKKRTPVLSGDLEKANNIERHSFDSVTFVNKMDYASFVNQGTYKMNANPFFTSGILDNLNGFLQIIVNEMKI